MPVITISRQFGSGGDEIADLISTSYEFSVIDKTILNQAAAETGVTEQTIIDLSEDSYIMRTLFDHLLGRKHLVSQIQVVPPDSSSAEIPLTLALSEAKAVSLVRNAMATAYARDNFVIVGRGGQVLLKNLPDVLHVRIEAPREDRLDRVCQFPEIACQTFNSLKDARRAAQNLIKERDATSYDYVKHYYHVDCTNPDLYHMVINTGKMSLELAARVIVEAARLLKAEVSPGE